MAPPEAWLRGPVEGVDPQLQPVAHALIQAGEELEALLSNLPAEHLHATPGGVASIAFHLQHLAGATDRLFTYARGDGLSDRQRRRLELEGTPTNELSREALQEEWSRVLDDALRQLRETSPQHLDDPRPVGRARLLSSVRGLLFHAAEHAARHVGQITTTAKLLRGNKSEGGENANP
jgi:uncharacterized damage-inducible protein DinB